MPKESTMTEPELAECTDGCGYVAVERNRYFTGKSMMARDFWADQHYFLTHHRLHNRLMHGWGIVCGLNVVRHPNPDCERWVVIRNGIAFDCCGRELILAKDRAFELPLPAGEDDESYEQGKTPEWRPFVLCLEYAECEIEPVPLLYTDCDSHCNGDNGRLVPNRIREEPRIEVRYLDDLDEGCWRVPRTGMDAPCREDCDDDIPAKGLGCVDPYCPCGSCVPLALIVPDDDALFGIRLGGRRELPPPAEYLTHVAGINWPHGGELTLEDLEDMNGRLEVRFDRRIQEADGEATGVNEHTFVVQYVNVQRDLEFLPPDPERRPYLSDDGCTAVFTIDPNVLGAYGRTIAGSALYVTLRCEFLLDCHGHAVSGRHLGGRLPSGDGTPGSLFESWFRVEDRRRGGREA
jgi:hypothetical protein